MGRDWEAAIDQLLRVYRDLVALWMHDGEHDDVWLFSSPGPLSPRASRDH